MITPSTPADTPSGARRLLTPRQQIYWTLGNLMMFAGIYLLLYVGGIYLQIEYQRLAARGDNDMQVSRALVAGSERPAIRGPMPTGQPAALPAFAAPLLANGQIAGDLPSPAQAAGVSSVERLVIPSINVDSKVIEVGWQEQEISGKRVAIWDVAEFAVGQHRGSANPGEGGNVVLAGHVGGYGKVFKDLFYITPGDQITIYSGGRQYLYLVEQRLVVDEDGAPPEQRATNAQLIAPTDHEVVTMVTCWPPKGSDKFKQRVIIRAIPYQTTPTSTEIAPQTIR